MTKTKTIKAFAVIRSSLLWTDYLKDDFDSKNADSEVYVIGKKTHCERWMNKWLGGMERSRIVPVSITYDIPEG